MPLRLAENQWFMVSRDGYIKSLEHGVMDEELAKERVLMWPDQYIGVATIDRSNRLIVYRYIRDKQTKTGNIAWVKMSNPRLGGE